jgi:hypothetical protein
VKGVIWIVACVVLLGCESRRLDTRTVESSRGGVALELATAVQRALAAKRVEEDRLVQYAVEKQRLVSRLMPLDVHWADLHPLAVEDYVTERDVEAGRVESNEIPWTTASCERSNCLPAFHPETDACLVSRRAV